MVILIRVLSSGLAAMPPPQQLQLGATVNTVTALWRQRPRLQRVPVTAAQDSDDIQIITMIRIHLGEEPRPPLRFQRRS